MKIFRSINKYIYAALKMNFEKKWQPNPVVQPGKSSGQKSLAGYGPWSWKRVRHNSVTKTMTATTVKMY